MDRKVLVPGVIGTVSRLVATVAVAVARVCACGAGAASASVLAPAPPYTSVRRALDATGRPIVLSICDCWESVNLRTLELGPGPYWIRDVWAHRSCATAGGLTFSLAPHSAVLLRVYG
jgi:hypothetical protein